MLQYYREKIGGDCVKKENPVALLPIGVFLVMYLGLGLIFEYVLKIPMGFYNVPIIIAFALNYAAYFAEIYRGGIEAMPKGQYEAAAVLGYSKIQTFMRIILPQVIKHILPGNAVS